MASTSTWAPKKDSVRGRRIASRVGTSARAPTSTTRSSDWTIATVRPRTASSTWVPMMVRPVRKATPANPPTSGTTRSAIHRCGASATGNRARPAPTMAEPKSRLCGMRCANLGAPAMPPASPRKMAANNRPYPVSPAERLLE